MFRNLRASTTLVILCCAFIVSIGATTYNLVSEKQIAIEFARKELVGNRYLQAVRSVYAAILAGRPLDASAAPGASTDGLIKSIVMAQENAGAWLQTREAAEALAGALRLWLDDRDVQGAPTFALDTLAKARTLVARIADDSNLVLDPDLDSYYVQDLVTRKLPAFLRQLGEVQLVARQVPSSGTSNEPNVRAQVSEGVLRSMADEVRDNLAAAYRGNSDGRLRRSVDRPFAAMLASANAYLDGLSAGYLAGAGSNSGRYGTLVRSAMTAWADAQSELDRLLHERIDRLVARMNWTVALTAALAALSILIAVMTHRHIVRPLQLLENVASTVRETKDYSLRMDYSSKNEIGQVAAAFNDMLSELAIARERERSEHAELARVARLTSMGVLTASIAHEINQPLAAIVTNSNAALRWLATAQPDLDEARAALKSIVSDGRRAGQVIGSVRTMFRKDSGERGPLAVNGVIEDILALVHGEIRKHGVLVQTELLAGLPHVVADRTQLQQVFMNLIMNAVEAMAAVAERNRILVVKTEVGDPGTVSITVQDSGTGIDPNDAKRIFEAFYTTKSDGMGMGLSICRSIIESHGGRLWASPGPSCGSVFHVVLPSSA